MNLHKSFASNQVLRGLNFTVIRNEMVALVGGSGGGKTVLLQHLIGQMQPDQGEVWLADHESPGNPLVHLATLDDVGMNRLRIHWAIVFQRNALLSGTVAGNLTLPLMLIKGLSAADSEPLIRKALQDVGLDPDTVLTLDREQLSGGMAKRIAIARALVMQPLLIFFDEPTTGLDPKSDELIQDLIFKTYCESPESSPATGANPPQPAVIPGPNTPAIAGNRTVLIVTHDRDLLRRLQPRIIMLDSGRICFDGSYDAFATAQSPIIRPYFDYMPALQHSRMPSLP